MSGYEPIKEDLILSRGGDYAHRYAKAQNDPVFPFGTTAEIVITKTNKTDADVVATWPANDITNSYIEFWVQAPEPDAIPERYRYRLIVHYPATAPATDGRDFVWYIGATKRSQ